LWLIVPEAKSTSDRLQMQGKPVTLESLKEIVDRADVEGAAKRAGKRVEPAALLIAKIFVATFGVLFIIVACAMLIGVATLGILAGFGHGVLVGGEKLFPVGAQETWLLLSGLAAVSVLALFCLFGGIGMVVRKWKVPGWVSGALVGVLLLGTASTAALTIDSIPQIRDRHNAMFHSAVTPVDPFQKLQLLGSGTRSTNYIYRQSSEYKVEYRYVGKQPDANFNKGVKDGVLTLDTGDMPERRCTIFCDFNDRSAEIIIYAPSIAAINLRGSNVFFSNAVAFTQSDLTLDIDLSASVNLNHINAKNVKITANPDANTSYIQLTGLRSDASSQDTLSSYGQTFLLTRAGEIEFNTNAQCLPRQAMLSLVNYPSKLTLNAKVFPTKGDLLREQTVSHSIVYDENGNITPDMARDRSPYNCVGVN
jgi:hypothetical protein